MWISIRFDLIIQILHSTGLPVTHLLHTANKWCRKNRISGSVGITSNKQAVSLILMIMIIGFVFYSLLSTSHSMLNRYKNLFYVLILSYQKFCEWTDFFVAPVWIKCLRIENRMININSMDAIVVVLIRCKYILPEVENKSVVALFCLAACHSPHKC